MNMNPVCVFYSPQNSHIDSHKKNSVRHKLISLTLKKKSKITEEVSDRSVSHRALVSLTDPGFDQRL